MSGELAKGMLLLALWCGLCPPAAANTTEPAPVVPVAPVVHIGLLLPLQSGGLQAAAAAVRAGFMAAFEREPGGVSIGVEETDDVPAHVLAAYEAATARYDLVVGPLSRRAAVAVVQRGAAERPTVILNALQRPDLASPPLPAGMLAAGLSLEDEARQAADWAAADRPGRSAYVISTVLPWQQRTAHAFAIRWRQLGMDARPVEIASRDGELDRQALAQLQARVRASPGAIVFAALDAGQARQLRQVLGRATPFYGTSQLNPFVLSGPADVQGFDDLDGVRLLDLPWQLQPDHPAVMIYPHLITPADSRPSPDMERLYALGIDAYRIAYRIAQGQHDFTLDGVTGALQVRFGAADVRITRTEVRAVYRGGRPVPLPGGAR